MKIKYRLVFLLVSLFLLIGVGYYATGNFDFIVHDLWFVSGLLILILSALIDQPFFSTDANVFMNGVSSLTLVLVENEARGMLWYFLLALCIWLVVSSYLTMVLFHLAPQKWTLFRETVSKLNRVIGKPTVIYSVFFLWGVFRQANAGKLLHPDALFIYWGIFVVFNIPSTSKVFSDLFDNLLRPKDKNKNNIGSINSVSDPNLIDIELAKDCDNLEIGSYISFTKPDGKILGEAIVLDLRPVSGIHLARVAVVKHYDDWKYIATNPNSVLIIHDKNNTELEGLKPISVVNDGSNLQTLKFDVLPESDLKRGMLVFVKLDSRKIYYQIVSAVVTSENTDQNNIIKSVSVSAQQLGLWNSEEAFFEEYPWVANPGELIFLETESKQIDVHLKQDQIQIGTIPKSNFPVNSDIQDLITHNTAILGVTGSGKTYLALSLIFEYIKNGVKVLIIDISKEYGPFLTSFNPKYISSVSEIQPWFDGDSKIGIVEFDLADNLPTETANHIVKIFQLLQSQKLVPGQRVPAKVCIVLEEAHSLIPEFGNYTSSVDQMHVNRSAKAILQGRKYGMGYLVITQRTANISKSILNQCNTMIALRCFDQTGLDFLKNYMGNNYSEALPTLANRNAVIVGKGSLSQTPIIFEIPFFETAQLIEPSLLGHAPTDDIAIDTQP